MGQAHLHPAIIINTSRIMFKSIILSTLALLCLLSGCSRQTYYFPATTGASVAYQQAHGQQADDAGSFSAAGEPRGPALASLERLPVKKYQASAEAQALAKHLSGEIKDNRKAASAPPHPVAVEENKSGQDKKLSYKQKKMTKLGKASFVLGLAGLAFLLLATVLPVLVFLGFLAAVLGTVLSITALTDIKKGPKKDRRKAKAGLVLGLITVVLSLIVSLNAYQW
jgi:hypothetical protein